MQVYFSHSYRDVVINSYFLEHFVREDIPLDADQKTDVWCVPKLERHLRESTAFVSIIPRRATERDAAAYSEYIGKELELARWARVPRLLFVDEKVLDRYTLSFPADAVPFRGEAPEQARARHAEAIKAFRETIETARSPERRFRPLEATVVAGPGSTYLRAAEDVAEILRREGYSVTFLGGRRRERAFDDIRLLEQLWKSELCVFVLEERLSETHVALAMAHADGIPCFRLQFDRKVATTTVALSGAMLWSSVDTMLVEFKRQLKSYREGLIRPVELARASGAAEAMRATGTMQWTAPRDNYWDWNDGPALIKHVLPAHTFVQDEVNRVRKQIKRSFGEDRGREGSVEITRALYAGIQRLHYGYELEPQTGTVGRQAIRTPLQIETHKTATCLDLACLFAALLEGAAQAPLIAILERRGRAHALAGYRSRHEPPWPKPELGDLRRAQAEGDALFFEATGAVESNEPVGAETAQERDDKLLAFADAQEAASRLLKDDDVRLRYLLDVAVLRKDRSPRG